MAERETLLDDPPALLGSRDPLTGQCYFPWRKFASDGSLRECEDIRLSTEGILHTWTRMGETTYGQIDLPEKVRVQCVLAAGEPEIGASYRLTVRSEGEDGPAWRFERA